MAHQFPRGILSLCKEVQSDDQAVSEYPEETFAVPGWEGQGYPYSKELPIRDCLAASVSYERGIFFYRSRAFMGHVWVIHAGPEPFLRRFILGNGHPGTVGVDVPGACLQRVL